MTMTKLIKNAVTYKPVELWKVELQDQFTINVVWLKDGTSEQDLAEFFGDQYVSAVRLNTGIMDPIHLIYDGSGIWQR